MLYKRVISGLLFLPVFYLVTWVLEPVYFAAFVLVAAVLGQQELYRMAKERQIVPNEALGVLLGALVVLDRYRPLVHGTSSAALFGIIVLLIVTARLFSPRPVDGALEDISVTLMGVLYVALLFSFQVAVRMAVDGKQWLVFLFFVIWATDIGAYSVGMPFGKHRLYEKVSPKKSIEGFLGALAGAAAMALLCTIWFMPAVGKIEALLIALVLALAGTIGDLAESLLKRAVGVKDSGTIIPGHGGILDRMDSMLFAAPVLYYYLTIR